MVGTGIVQSGEVDSEQAIVQRDDGGLAAHEGYDAAQMVQACIPIVGDGHLMKTLDDGTI